MRVLPLWSYEVQVHPLSMSLIGETTRARPLQPTKSVASLAQTIVGLESSLLFDAGTLGNIAKLGDMQGA